VVILGFDLAASQTLSEVSWGVGRGEATQTGAPGAWAARCDVLLPCLMRAVPSRTRPATTTIIMIIIGIHHHPPSM